MRKLKASMISFAILFCVWFINYSMKIQKEIELQEKQKEDMELLMYLIN